MKLKRARRAFVEKHRPLALALALPLCAAAAPLALAAASGSNTNCASDQLLLTDRLGRSVPVSTNAVARTLHPPAAVGLERQIPATTKGASMPDPVAQRIAASKVNQAGWLWFPATPPVLMPYLANLDEFGNTAIQHGAVFPDDPFSTYPQSAKYWLSTLGLRYSFYQSVTMVSLSDTASGAILHGYLQWQMGRRRGDLRWDRRVVKLRGEYSTRTFIRQPHADAAGQSGQHRKPARHRVWSQRWLDF